MCIIIYKIRIRRGYKSKLNYLTKLIYYIVLCVRNSFKGVNVCVLVWDCMCLETTTYINYLCTKKI